MTTQPIPISEDQSLFFCPSIFIDRFWIRISSNGTLRLTFGEQGPEGHQIRVSVTLTHADGLEMLSVMQSLIQDFVSKGGGKQ